MYLLFPNIRHISFHVIPCAIAEKQKVPTDATDVYLPSVVNKILTIVPANIPQVSMFWFVFRWARFINFPISREGTTTFRNPILEWIDGLRREAGFVLLSTLGNGRVLKWKIHASKCK